MFRHKCIYAYKYIYMCAGKMKVPTSDVMHI